MKKAILKRKNFSYYPKDVSEERLLQGMRIPAQLKLEWLEVMNNVLYQPTLLRIRRLRKLIEVMEQYK